MPKILCIESAGARCSLALFDTDKVLASVESTGANAHARELQSLAAECLAKANCSWKELEAIAVSGGPGSYTGLRIGMAAAKAYCYALDIPLISFSSLDWINKLASQKYGAQPTKYLACLKAKGETAILRIQDESGNVLIPDRSYDPKKDVELFVEAERFVLSGDGVYLLPEPIKTIGAIFIEYFHASLYLRLVNDFFTRKIFTDSAYSEPVYQNTNFRKTGKSN